MTKEIATKEAREIATRDAVEMAVTFNPYGEEELEEERFGYFPLAATYIFKHEKVILEIAAGGKDK